MATQNNLDKKSASLTLDPGASGDSFIQFDINTTGEFIIGVDDTDDSFRVSQGSALGTNDTFIMTASGERTMPLQPAVLTYDVTAYDDVTGDGTAFTIPFSTEIFDQGSDFSSNTFTAPITGRYFLGTAASFIKSYPDGSVTYSINIVTSNRTYYCLALPGRGSLSQFYGSNVWLGMAFSCFADMDVGDTATLEFTGSGGTKIDEMGRESVSCMLVC